MNKATNWVYNNAVSDEDIDRILSHADGDWDDANLITGNTETAMHKLRKTDIKWLNEQWIHELFNPMLNGANNQANWNLQINSVEEFQLGRYTDGGHYDWHMDGNMMDTNDSNTTRKISMVCWLNEDFEGGEFEFMGGNKIKPVKGTVLFFPAFYLHKVHPVTEGARYSLVTWYRGAPIV